MAQMKPVDPDVDLHVRSVRAELSPSPLPVIGAIAAGGVVGALARFGLSSAWSHPAGAFPWSTFVVNVSGCVLIGALMVLVDQVWSGRRLLRPFLGVGVLGGYTTFSAYAVDIHQSATSGAPGTALVYLAGSVVAAVVGVWAGSILTERAIRPRRTRRVGAQR